MLVLTRRKGEDICIHNDIVVTILAVRGDRVRLGIQAPRDVPVHREEVAKRAQSPGGQMAERQEERLPPCLE